MSQKHERNKPEPQDLARPPLPVWFYIGALLGTYGVLLTVAGVYQIAHPPDTVLAEYHATLWAGLLLLAIGGTYLALYRPKKS